MPNLYGAPEISVQEVKQKIEAGDDFILLDVREEWELRLARLEERRVRVAPLSRLATQGQEALPPEVQDRQAEVTAWLLEQGWQDVRSMAGGLEAYAMVVDPAVGQY